ncbi:hypothetical protein GCM10027456_77030 [Kineosporia babensis]
MAVTDPQVKAKAAALTVSETFGIGSTFIEQAPAFLLWVADLSRSHSIATEAGTGTEVVDYLDSFLMASIDAAVAAQNAVVAAEALGLGVVYIGAARNKADEMAQLLELPPHSFVAFGMVVGSPDPAQPTQIRPRPPQALVLHHDRYSAQQSMDNVEAYEPVLRDFLESSGSTVRTWREMVAFSTSSMDYMDGRQNLRETLHSRGFQLR